MLSPLVSVIIPVHNSEKFLACTIQSVLEQTFQDLELIVIDDGSSTSECQEITKYFQEISSLPIYYYYQENKGPSAARNYGIKHAKGEFISFLDSDDFYETDKLSLQLNLLTNLPQNYAGVFGGEAIFLERDPARMLFFRPPRIDGFAYEALIEKDIYLGLSSCSLLRKKALETVGGFDESLRYGEDFYLVVQIAHQFKLKSHPEIVCWRRKRKDSLSRTNPITNLEHSLQFIEKIQRMDNTIHRKFFDRKRKKAFFYAAASFLFSYRDHEKFCFYMQQGVDKYGFPDTYKEWIGFLMAKTSFLTKFLF